MVWDTGEQLLLPAPVPEAAAPLKAVHDIGRTERGAVDPDAPASLKRRHIERERRGCDRIGKEKFTIAAMQDFIGSDTSLVLILVVIALLAIPIAGWYGRKAYWRRLRMRGDPRAKRREAERRRRQA